MTTECGNILMNDLLKKSLIIKNTVQEYKEKLQHKSFVIKADKNT